MRMCGVDCKQNMTAREMKGPLMESGEDLQQSNGRVQLAGSIMDNQLLSRVEYSLNFLV